MESKNYWQGRSSGKWGLQNFFQGLDNKWVYIENSNTILEKELAYIY